MHLELLGDSLFDQVINTVVPTDWKTTVAANIGLPVTTSNMLSQGKIVQAMWDDYNKIISDMDITSDYTDATAHVIAEDTGQTDAIGKAFLAEVQKHDLTGQWVLAAGKKDPNAATLPDTTKILGSVQNIFIAGAVIVGGYFAIQALGFIPRPRSR